MNRLDICLTSVLAILPTLADAAWTKMAGPDSIRNLSAASIVYQQDVLMDAVLTGRGDSVLGVGGFSGWGKGVYLGPGNVTATIVNESCYAGTATGRIFLRPGCANNWVELTGAVPVNGAAIRVLARFGSEVFAGTSQGVFRRNTVSPWTPLNTGLTQLSVNALAVSGALFCAATDSGIFVSLNSGSSWSAKGAVRGPAKVRFLTGSASRLLAATDSGVYRSRDSGTSWVPLNTGLANRNTYGLVDADTNLFVATDGGVFRSANSGGGWSLLDSGMTTGPVYAIVGARYGSSPGSTLYAGNNAGIWRQYFSNVAVSVEPGSRASSNFHFGDPRRISFSLRAPSRVVLEAFTPSGRRVAVLLNEFLAAGSHRRRLSANALPAGLYVYRLKTDEGIQSRLVPVSR